MIYPILVLLLSLVVFGLYLKRKERRARVDNRGIGSGRNHICRVADDSSFPKCAVCNKGILRAVDRVVSYENALVCYLCWKRHSFINISEKLFLLRDIFGDDILLHIKEWMFHEDWEVNDFMGAFPTDYHDSIIPHYRTIPTLKLPNSFTEQGDGILVQWVGSEQKLPFLLTHWIVLNINNDDTYYLLLFTYNFDKYLHIQQEEVMELNTENLVDTLRLINFLQYKTLEEIQDFSKCKLENY